MDRVSEEQLNDMKGSIMKDVHKLVDQVRHQLSHDKINRQLHELMNHVTEMQSETIPKINTEIQDVKHQLATQQDFYSKSVQSLEAEVKNGFETLEYIRIKMIRERSDFQIQF